MPSSANGFPGVASREHTSGGDRARRGREWGHQKELLELARAADVPVILRITAGDLAERRPPLFGESAERGSEPPERLLQ
jgi:hypothetical protein